MRAVLAIAAGAAVLLAASYASKRAADAVATSDAGDGSTSLDIMNPWGFIEHQVEQSQTETAMRENLNLPAFLDAIAWGEGTLQKADPYRVCYGYHHTIVDLSDHPAVTGEWRGEDISGLGAQYIGKVSTAAGKYQIIRPTWLAAKRALSLPDFSPDSQDKAAVWLIRNRGALDDIAAGRIADAVDKCAAEWASLPGSTSGQPQRRLAAWTDFYATRGGAFA